MKAFIFSGLLMFLFFAASGQTMDDTIFNYFCHSEVVIDGQATEDCWASADWHVIDQVWIPYNQNMNQGDFEGKFKVSWDSDYLYVLVQVIDDMLSDDYSNPLSNWWNDDCLEVFIDENRSMGDHERNNNAFAYHVSLFYDAIDLNSNGSGINYKDNLEVEMDTIGENTYLWEMAIKIYDESFSISNPEASRVDLINDKLMGFTIAYCDNDETTSRENFIGSMFMPESNYNDSYKNADFFGPMLLKNTNSAGTGGLEKTRNIKIYPIPSRELLFINLSSNFQGKKELSLFSTTGILVKSMSFEGNSINLDIRELKSGLYMLRINDGEKTHSKLVVKE